MRLRNLETPQPHRVAPTTDASSLLNLKQFVQLSATKGFSAAARLVGSSERTLRRRFAERGVRLRDAVEGFRKREVVTLLAVGASLAAARQALGFASASGFSRFVRRCFGIAPAKLRRQILISSFLSKDLPRFKSRPRLTGRGRNGTLWPVWLLAP